LSTPNDFIAQYEARTGVNMNLDHYNIMKIPKKSGGVRIIHSPDSFLKEEQKKILFDLYRLPINFSPSVCAFQHKKSVTSVAKQHAENHGGVKIDIKDFFPSCSPKLVVHILSKITGVSKDLVDRVKKYCFSTIYPKTFDQHNEAGLPQGALTSPFLSNLALFSFDRRMLAYLKKIELSFYPSDVPYIVNNLQYTRYADDIIVSYRITSKIISPDNGNYAGSNRIKEYVDEPLEIDLIQLNEGITKFIEKNLKRFEFKVNPKKTKYWRYDSYTRMCGVILKQPHITMDPKERLSTSKKERDYWRGRIHKMLKDIETGKCAPGFRISKKGAIVPIDFPMINGHINWFKQVNEKQYAKIGVMFNKLKKMRRKNG